jgi:integrase/recombinase XerD
MFLLLLYATGCSVGELHSLRRGDIDLKRRAICFRTSPYAAERRVPINERLRQELAAYIRRPAQALNPDGYAFVDRSGRAVREWLVKDRFRKLLKQVHLEKRSDGRTPRLIDLRFTFAVHRLDQCVREKGDVDRLLPALSTYMGYAVLGASERFLFCVPNRFRDDLRRLSPSRGRRHWRNDAALMKYLQGL